MATMIMIVLLLLSISCLCSTKDVYIQPSEGERHCPGICYNVTTFGKMAGIFSNLSGLVVHFLEGTHLLDLQKLVVFTNLTNGVFEGNGRMEQGFHETVWQSTVVIKCTDHSSTGIAFVSSFNITFKYITITNCGADMKTFCRSGIFCKGSLAYFEIGHLIKIDHVSIQNGTGNGLLIETDHGVDLNIIRSSFSRNTIQGDFHGANIGIVYLDPLTCVPLSDIYNLLILGKNSSFSFATIRGHRIGGGLHITYDQRSYIVATVLDSVTAFQNTGYGNIIIAVTEYDVCTYNLTIINSLSSHANGWALGVFSFPTPLKQCPATQSASLVSVITIVNSNLFTTTTDAVKLFHLMLLHGITLSRRIIMQSIEVCHNIGFDIMLYFELLSFQYQGNFFVTLENVIAINNTNNSVVTSPAVVYANGIDNLMLSNVSIINNRMSGIILYATKLLLNGTLVLRNNTGIDGGGLALYQRSYLVLYKNSVLNFTNNTASKEEEPYLLIFNSLLVPASTNTLITHILNQ